MKVFILMGGESGEGGSIRGVYKWIEEAHKELVRISQDPKTSFVASGYEIFWALDGNSFEIGCDWYSITEWEVKE